MTELRRGRLVAGLLSFVAPGFGQIYVGASTRGLVFFLIALVWPTLGIYVADRFRSAAVVLLVGAGAFVLQVVSTIDAFRLARNPQVQHSVLGRWYYALIVALLWRFIAIPTWDSNIKREIAEAYAAGVAMQPTLLPGDWVLAGRKRDPIQRRDIVVFQQGVAENARWYTLRVVGLGNDTIEMRDGRFILNGVLSRSQDITPITEDFTYERAFDWQLKHLLPGIDTASYEPSMANWGPFVVPPGNIFLLGDNRQNANDSRFLGFVDTGWVWGEAHVVYFSWDPGTRRVRWERIGYVPR